MSLAISFAGETAEADEQCVRAGGEDAATVQGRDRNTALGNGDSRGACTGQGAAQGVCVCVRACVRPIHLHVCIKQAEVAGLVEKLQWYAENQKLLDHDYDVIQRKDQEIAQLEERISKLQVHEQAILSSKSGSDQWSNC